MITVNEAAEQWGLHPQRVRQLIAAGRINGAVKFGRDWQIPARTGKPKLQKRGRKPA